MLGPEAAGDRAAAWLTTAVPRRLRIIEARLDLDPGSIGDPDHVDAVERGPLGVEEWPAIYVLPQELRGIELADVLDGGAELYRTTYRLRVLAWVRADGYAETDTLRKRYVLAIREALLERRALKVSESIYVGDPNADLSVDPNSIRESYSEVLLDGAEQTVAGAWLDVDVTVAEVLEGPPAVGTVLDTDVTGTHPALT